MHASDEVKQGGFTGTIAAYDSDEVRRVHLEVYII
jgi:hypothetical protein